MLGHVLAQKGKRTKRGRVSGRGPVQDVKSGFREGRRGSAAGERVKSFGCGVQIMHGKG